MSPSATVILLGTCDTKLEETLLTRDQILSHGLCSVLVADVGRTPTVAHKNIDITNRELLGRFDGIVDLSTLPRAEYIKRIISCAASLVKSLYQSGAIHGIIGIGGSSGTALSTGVMRQALPIGFPKLMVSTMASGNVKPYVEETDITMMYSVVDIVGTNSILNRVLSNAAAAIACMAATFAEKTAAATTVYTSTPGTGSATPLLPKKRVGVTMFGVTTPCVDRIRDYLGQTHGYEVYIFHATGSGGRAMERLISEHQLDAVLDITTTEIADAIVGGMLAASPDRLEAAAKSGIPQVISVGACDMVNFGPPDSVPVKFSGKSSGKDHGRLLYEHNPSVTLMRTTPDECRQIARFIAQKLLLASRPEMVRVVLPTGGVSMMDTPGQPFYDPEADAVLFSTLEEELAGSRIQVIRAEQAINEDGFAVLVAELLVGLVEEKASHVR
ncbi:hypothetical protein MPDQ_002942 [Monascus purpureus]|uniref:Uncharacterized protein n=1 Tax=Monascus purpureus TaxID=5098 RepID=A0A507QJJ3_MONPU|nr:hypothetical protein MPDQ_002942 [Monascus purpureus]BDD54812.1 hypothetical protein MAP00_000394 [Monascus purpureus]